MTEFEAVLWDVGGVIVDLESVRSAHGSGDSSVDRELTRVQEEARTLEEGRRDN